MPLNPNIPMSGRGLDLSRLGAGFDQGMQTVGNLQDLRARKQARQAEKAKTQVLNTIRSKPMGEAPEEILQRAQEIFQIDPELGKAYEALGQKRLSQQQQATADMESKVQKLAKFETSLPTEQRNPRNFYAAGMQMGLPMDMVFPDLQNKQEWSPEDDYKIQALAGMQEQQRGAKTFEEEQALINARTQGKINVAQGKSDIKVGQNLTKWQKAKEDRSDRELQRDWAKINIGKEQYDKDYGLKSAPGWQEVDKQFAKDYNDLVGQGKIADAVKIVEQVQDVRQSLSDAVASGQNLTGPLLSMMPESALKRINPEATDVRELLEEVVQRNLREVLGAQFTEKEGERLISRAYNPALDEKVNAERVGRLLEQVQSALSAKLESIAYFEENGTMRGYSSAALKNAIKNLKNMAGKRPVKKSSTKITPKAKTKTMSDEDLLNEIWK